MTTNLLQAAKDAAQALDRKFGKDIVVLDIRDISVVSDYFVIAEAGNPNQVQSMVSEVEGALDKYNINLRHIEGMQRADWVLMDFGDIIVHILNNESRVFYNLDRVWCDAKEVAWS